MVVRRAHLVGSIAGDDAGAAMRLALDKLRPDLDYLPDGETGERRNWVISMIERFRDHPDMEVSRRGDWSDYDKVPRFAVRRGHKLTASSIDLGIGSAARESFPQYRALIEAGPGVAAPSTFQVGIPGDVDLALFTFGPLGPLLHRRPFTEALGDSMRDVQVTTGGDVVFQIELPVELVLLTQAPGFARPVLARLLAGRVAALASGASEGSRFGIHLCLGDMNHRALGRMSDTGPLVALANAIVRRWPAGRTLEFMHAPLAAADNPPSVDPAFYRPLRDLELGPSVRFIGGYAHEDQPLEDQQKVQALVENALGHPADVSTSCGLGRREPAAAAAAMERIKALL